MERIPASVLRVAVPGKTFADALPHLAETYTGTIAYELEHIAGHNRRVWLRQAIESGEYRQPLSEEEKKRLLGRLSEVEALEGYLHKAFLGKKQFSIEGLDVLVPMLDETHRAVLGQRRPPGDARHGPPRPAQRARAHRRAALRVDPRGVRGRAEPVGGHRQAHGRHRRREVPLRRHRHLPHPGGQGGDGAPVAQPQPPRVREPRDRGPRARRADQPQGPGDQPRPQRRRAGADPRRRRLPRPGRGGRDAQPPGAARLLHRRHGAHHRQQPAGLHHRPRTRAAPRATRRTWPRASTYP